MKKIFSLILVALITMSNYSCTDTMAKEKSTPEITTTTPKAGFIHTVFFWMKDDFDDAKRQRFEAGMKKLAKVSSIQSVYWGTPAGTDREVVDNSYDYAWIVHFANAADQDAYQVDPIHLNFVEECKDIWEKVQVYDSVIKN